MHPGLGELNLNLENCGAIDFDARNYTETYSDMKSIKRSTWTPTMGQSTRTDQPEWSTWSDQPGR